MNRKNSILFIKSKKEKNCEKRSGGSSVNDICFYKIKFLKLIPSCNARYKINQIQWHQDKMVRTQTHRTTQKHVEHQDATDIQKKILRAFRTKVKYVIINIGHPE